MLNWFLIRRFIMKKKSLIYRLTALAMTVLIVAGCGKTEAGSGEKRTDGEGAI